MSHLYTTVRTAISQSMGMQRSTAVSGTSTNLWLTLWACMLAFAWLLPNHYQPWSAFHSDAWSAVIIGLAAVVVLAKYSGPVAWNPISMVIAGLVGLPLVQYAFDILPFAGQAWIGAAYLLGLLLALLTGVRWEASRPSQVADGLFLAISIAAVFSVGLQLHQWLALDGLEIWSMGIAGGRPYGNLGQPNQLGTLLLWGLLACAWGATTKKVSPSLAVFLSCFLLIGIALTMSRTAWIGLFLMVSMAWAGRRLWPSRWAPFVVLALAVFFVVCNFAIREITDFLLLSGGPDIAEKMRSDARPAAWRLFIDAALQRPWFGYGWSSVGVAQMAVAQDHPSLGITFQHSHNLFIDLVLWCGIPLGLILSTLIVYWFWRCMRGIRNLQDLILFAFLVVIGNHAMLELPLHYAYFLLPTGLVAGALTTRLGSPMAWTPRWVPASLCVVGALLLSVLIRDYLLVEANFYALRFERARVGTLPPSAPPDVILLTHLREELRLARFTPKVGMSESEIAWVRDAAGVHPGPSELYRLASSLALNGQVSEAQLTLKKLCGIVPAAQCELVKRVWAQDSQTEQQKALVRWPN